MSALKSELIQICQLIGTEIPLWTQGSGSNVSVKEQGKLWIKASGFRLDSVSKNNGIACLRYQNFIEQLKEVEGEEWEQESLYSKIILDSRILDDSQFRPSMESGFHAILPKKWVVHFHSLVSIWVSQLYDTDRELIVDWLNKNLSVSYSFFPQCRPGWLLSSLFLKHNSSSLYFLKNHGIIFQTDEYPETFLSEWKRLEKRFCERYGYFTDRKAGALPTLKIYFPDVAVFEDRILKILKQSDKGLTLIDRAKEIDRDAFEIWEANQILFANQPLLSELSSDFSNAIVNLPTEKARQEIGRSI